MKWSLCVCLILFIGIESFSQLPQSAIYLLHVENPDDTSWKISQVEYLNGFNPNGYNNQPYFFSQNELMASVRTVNSDNTEIYYFDLINKTYKNVTSSKASEYSPRQSPSNSQHISCVSVPEKDTSIQNLVEINISNGAYSKVIFNKFAKIGYYRHIKDQLWACYLVEEPHVLSLCDAGKLTKKIFASSIGRSFEVLNQNEILFVHKITAEHWILKSYNIVTEKSKTLAEMPPGTEDFVLDQNHNLLCASDTKLYKLSKEGRWQMLTDLTTLKIKNINRIAIKNNLVAVVSVAK